MEKRIISINNKYDSKVYVIDEIKSIYKIVCDCGDFQHRRIKKDGVFSDIKYYSSPCKHTQPIVEALEKQGYTLKKPKPMTGTDKCTTELRKLIFERSNGLCEANCGRHGKEIHRRTPKTNGGKYNEDNCVLLCKECHQAITYQKWQGSPGAKK